MDVEIQVTLIVRQILFGITELDRCRLLGSDAEVAHGTDEHRPPVRDDLPVHHIAVQGNEEIFVIDLDDTGARLLGRGMGQDGTILIGHFIRMRMQAAVRGNDAVAVERCIRGIVIVEITAEDKHVIGPAILAVDRPPEGLIHEIPDTTALEQGILAEQIPVFLESAQRIAHRVGIFALDHRTFLRLGSVVLAGRIISIHRAEDIGIPFLLRTLILDGTGRIELLDPGIGLLEIRTGAGLVAQAPDNHRRVVDIPLDPALDPLHVCLLIHRLLGERFGSVPHAV